MSWAFAIDVHRPQTAHFFGLIGIDGQIGAEYADATHLWVFKDFSERSDNLLCAVLVLEDQLIVKTVMHHFEVL